MSSLRARSVYITKRESVHQSCCLWLFSIFSRHVMLDSYEKLWLRCSQPEVHWLVLQSTCDPCSVLDGSSSVMSETFWASSPSDGDNKHVRPMGIHAYHYGSTVFVPENHQNQQDVPEIRIASQEFRILSFMKQQQTNMAFPVFPESSWSFCARTYWSHVWTHWACAKDRNMQICWKCSAHAWKTRSKGKFLWSFPKRTSHPWSCMPNRSSESERRL